MSDVPAASIENIDKAAHLFFYAVFSMLWLSYFRSRIQNTRKLFLAVFFFSATFGITIEFCQAVFTDYRQADLIDAAVNTIGAVLGLSLMALFIKKNKK